MDEPVEVEPPGATWVWAMLLAAVYGGLVLLASQMNGGW